MVRHINRDLCKDEIKELKDKINKLQHDLDDRDGVLRIIANHDYDEKLLDLYLMQYKNK